MGSYQLSPEFILSTYLTQAVANHQAPVAQQHSDGFCMEKCFSAQQARYRSLLVGEFLFFLDICSRFKTHSPNIVHAA
jgi:hypothetical protein